MSDSSAVYPIVSSAEQLCVNREFARSGEDHHYRKAQIQGRQFVRPPSATRNERIARFDATSRINTQTCDQTIDTR